MFSNPENLLIVLLIVLVLFGAKRLPGIGRGLGHGMREFKEGITGGSKPEDDDAIPKISQATATPEAAPAPDRPREPADAGTERSA